ncbi:GIY-YIG nuclease family protein [Sorangium sp. So ce385]
MSTLNRAELGDASVPFEFDVHAMIWSEDAPALENALHREFHYRRANLINERKEFFHVEIDEGVRLERNVSFAAGGPGARCLDGFSETPQPPNNALHADEARADARDLAGER